MANFYFFDLKNNVIKVLSLSEPVSKVKVLLLKESATKIEKVKNGAITDQAQLSYANKNVQI